MFGQGGCGGRKPPTVRSATSTSLIAAPVSTHRQEADVRASGAEAMVAHLKLLIAKMKHDPSSAAASLLDQLELQLEKPGARETQDDFVFADVGAKELGRLSRPKPYATSMSFSRSSARSTALRPTIGRRAEKPVSHLRVADLEDWMRQRARPAAPLRCADIAKATDYVLKRWPARTRFLDDGRICLSNNAAERMLRGYRPRRGASLFAGSDRGVERAAAMSSRSARRNSTTSIRKPGLLTWCIGSLTSGLATPRASPLALEEDRRQAAAA